MYSHSSTSRDNPISRLVFELAKLPGIGEKTAMRLAYFIMKKGDAYCQDLSSAILAAKQKITFCDTCFNFTDSNPCKICSDEKRNKSMICVVENPSDVYAVERSMGYSGNYHVLHGALSPLDGIGPDDIKVKELIHRLDTKDSSNEKIEELILATNPSVDGDTTALYIAKLVQGREIRVSKLAHGIPVGGQLEYSDQQTIHKALENRVVMN